MTKMKNLLLLLLCLTTLVACTENTTPKENVESATEKITEEEERVPKIVGRYTFTDDYGDDWSLKVNEDETCQLHFSNEYSVGKTFYGTWQKVGEAYELSFTEYLYFTVNGVKDLYSICAYVDSNCKWYYAGYNAHKAKDPNKRMKLNRVR